MEMSFKKTIKYIDNEPQQLSKLEEKLLQPVHILDQKLLDQPFENVFHDDFAAFWVANENSDIGHYVCAIIHDNHVEYFDSYGGMNETFLRYITQLGFDPDKIWYNSEQIQKFETNVCGSYVLSRFLMKHVPLDVYLYIITNHKHLHPDAVVQLMAPISPDDDSI